mmetsp:Transcript_11046/g.31464  ORF Transcript_11046/g.31464 Transcript_11046/m.31464 type:complete len:244 (-) Transcript_11046:547-1278(-)
MAEAPPGKSSRMGASDSDSGFACSLLGPTPAATRCRRCHAAATGRAPNHPSNLQDRLSSRRGRSSATRPISLQSPRRRRCRRPRRRLRSSLALPRAPGGAKRRTSGPRRRESRCHRRSCSREFHSGPPYAAASRPRFPPCRRWSPAARGAPRQCRSRARRHGRRRRRSHHHHTRRRPRTLTARHLDRRRPAAAAASRREPRHALPRCRRPPWRSGRGCSQRRRRPHMHPLLLRLLRRLGGDGH